MALSVVSSKGSSNAYTVAAVSPVVEVLARLAHAPDSVEPAALVDVVAHARHLGLTHEATLFAHGVPWELRDLDPRAALPPAPSLDPADAQMAARSILSHIAFTDRKDDGLAAVDALTGGLMRYDAVQRLAYDGLGLTGEPEGFAALVEAAARRAARAEDLEIALTQGGLLHRTKLSRADREAMEATLHALPFDFVKDVRLSDQIDWNPSKTMPGVAHGRALRLVNDPNDGSVIIPIQMAAMCRYFEHGHVGREHIVSFPGSAPLNDRQGRYTLPAEYAMPAGSFHTPFVPVGGQPAMFLGVAEYGVVLSPFGVGTRAAELLELAGAAAADVARLFRETPPDDRTTRQSPRTDLARALFGDLDFLARHGSLELDHYRRPAEGGEPVWQNLVRSTGLPSPSDLVQMVLEMKPEERIAWARERHFKARVVSPRVG